MSETKQAKLFWSGRSQAVRLPKEFRFEGEAVMIHREGNAVVLQPLDDWPEGYVESFAGVANDLERPDPGPKEDRFQDQEREPSE